MPQIFANNAISTLSAALTAGATSVLLQPGHGSRFPTIAAPDFCYCTLEDALGNLEIVMVTAHASGAQSMTVTRGQQGTTARAWAIGDLFELRLTAVEAGAWESDIDALQATRSIRSGDSYTGTHSFSAADVRVATPTLADQPATKAFVEAQAFSAALPNQTGNAGKFLSTSGVTASWTDPVSPTFTYQLQRALLNSGVF